MLEKIKIFFRKPFWTDYRTLVGLWLLLGIIAALTKMGASNNFKIFRGVFWHVWNGTPLFTEYPQEYFDVNHYGPFFSLVIAPFAVTPFPIGLIMWEIALALSLYVAIRKLPLLKWQHAFIFWFCAHELLTALFMNQFNIVIAAIIVASYYCIEKEKDWLATLLIVIGTLVKLYGIVGLAFFFFSRHKTKFIVSFVIWSVVLFCLPMLISSPEYIIGQYQAWYECLGEKNADNMFSMGTNISILGLVRKISRVTTYSDLCIIIPGLIAFALPYLRFKQYKNRDFRYSYLASVLMFVVLFSTGSESSGYITPFVGICLWYLMVPWKRTGWDIALMVFAFILSSMSPSDLFPAYIRKNFVQPYALKALPIVLIWFKLVYEQLTHDYTESEITDSPIDINRPMSLQATEMSKA